MKRFIKLGLTIFASILTFNISNNVSNLKNDAKIKRDL